MPQEPSREYLHAETVRNLLEQLQVKDTELRKCEARKFILSLFLTVVLSLAGVSIISFAICATFLK